MDRIYPLCLNTYFYDPPYVERVDGAIGGSYFRRELKSTRFEQITTNREKQTAFVGDAWEVLHRFKGIQNLQVVAALRYFHTACRLMSSEEVAGEYLSEVVLNLCKSLESLFPAEKGQGSRDAVRAGLATLGLLSSRIEREFMPVMALRSELDVAHIALFQLDHEQAQVVSNYVESIEASFRELFRDVLRKVQCGETVGTPKNDWKPSRSVSKVIDRMRAELQEDKRKVE